MRKNIPALPGDAQDSQSQVQVEEKPLRERKNVYKLFFFDTIIGESSTTTISTTPSDVEVKLEDYLQAPSLSQDSDVEVKLEDYLQAPSLSQDSDVEVKLEDYLQAPSLSQDSDPTDYWMATVSKYPE